MSSFVFWNNKGGVGKSTLCFQVACQYARQHPNRRILIVDLSPQCDSSRMVLGGGFHDGEQAIIGLMSKPDRPTIQGYLNNCLNDVPTGNGWPLASSFIVSPNQVRQPTASPLPPNLRLLCGDFDLERTVQLIDLMPQPPGRGGRTPSGPQYSTKALVRSFIRRLVDDFHIEHNNNCAVFIDTDPYFNVVTTHLGLAGADNLITTYTPGSQASQYAVERSIEFLFDQKSGLNHELQREYQLYPTPWFDNRGNPLHCPKISAPNLFLQVCNMATPYKQRGKPPYSSPQQLHNSVLENMQQKTTTNCNRYQIQTPNFDYMWDFKRLGLLCDYHGIDIDTLQTGQRYAQSGSTSLYQLATTGGTPIQLAAYKQRLQAFCAQLP
ncbi:ParA family protein [Metapseudomonas otitidis]|uniref:ParA family protein n=1 Tax=Metapseudomonas otitidis TaxID=319939 RepID=UPI0013F6563E|nr:ParA family protein [Pseudomonas otitidis]